VHYVHSLLLYDYSCTRIIILPQSKESWTIPFTAFATATVAKNNHNNTSGNHTNIRQKKTNDNQKQGS
jgi:hypothetical protein